MLSELSAELNGFKDCPNRETLEDAIMAVVNRFGIDEVVAAGVYTARGGAVYSLLGDPDQAPAMQALYENLFSSGKPFASVAKAGTSISMAEAHRSLPAALSNEIWSRPPGSPDLGGVIVPIRVDEDEVAIISMSGAAGNLAPGTSIEGQLLLVAIYAQNAARLLHENTVVRFPGVARHSPGS